MDGVTDSRARRVGMALVAAAAVLWSTGGVGVKIADAAPLVIAGWRSVFAFVVMALWLTVQLQRIRGERRARAMVLALARRPLVWAAATSYAVMIVCFVLAVRRTTAANAIVLQYTAPIHVALLSGPLLGERIRRHDVAVVACCLLGMVLACSGELGGGRAVGNVLAIVSGLGFAGLPLLVRLDQQRLVRAGGASVILATAAPLFVMVLGNALASSMALPAMIASPVRGEHAATTWAVLAALGVLQIAFPYVLYGIAVQRLRALETTLVATIEPVLSPLWVFFATGERPSALALAGGALILCSVIGQAALRARTAS